MNRFESIQFAPAALSSWEAHLYPNTSRGTLRYVKSNSKEKLTANLVILPDSDAQATSRYSNEQSYFFTFGAYGCTGVIVWARGIESALEKAVEYLANHARGFITEPDYDEARKEWECDNPNQDSTTEEAEEEIREMAEADLTYTESGWIVSYEWYVCEIDRKDILAKIKEQIDSNYDVLVLV